MIWDKKHLAVDDDITYRLLHITLLSNMYTHFFRPLIQRQNGYYALYTFAITIIIFH